MWITRRARWFTALALAAAPVPALATELLDLAAADGVEPNTFMLNAALQGRLTD